MPAPQVTSRHGTPPSTNQGVNRIHKPFRNRIGSRRAQTACAFCRWRKVRCNAEESTPCSNCAFEEVECVVGKKKQRRRTPYQPPVPHERQSPERSINDNLTPRNESPSTMAQQMAPIVLQRADLQADSYPDPGGEGLLSRLNAAQDKSTFQITPTFDFSASPTDLDSPFCFSRNGTICSPRIGAPQGDVLPSYLAPIPNYLEIEDLDYLRRKGAFNIPEPVLRDALLRSYIEFVHPCLPVLDLADFVYAIDSPVSQGNRLSLLLFQAVMFAGSAWVDIKLLRRLGFLTRKAARKSLFQKVRVIYDSDYEQDRLCLVQALVLCSLWWEAPDAQKDGWHWMGLAISLARTIELNRDPATLSLDLKTQSLRKRIWWCCLIRDPIVSIGTNRPARIKSEDFDVPMLSIDDFDITEIPSEVSCVSQGCLLARDLEKQRQLAILCIEMAKLCRHISRILTLEYADLPRGQAPLFSDRNLRFEKVSSPPASPEDSSKLGVCEEELRLWMEELPEEATYISPYADESESLELIHCIHRSLLSILYFNAIGILHRPRLHLDSATREASRNPTSEQPRSVVRYAATQVTKIAMDLYRLDLIRLLPATGISCLIPASMSHIDDMTSRNHSISLQGRRGLAQCRQVLQEFRDGHFAADFATQVLEYVVDHTNRPEAPDARTPNSKSSIDGLIREGSEVDFLGQKRRQRTDRCTPPPDPLRWHPQRCEDNSMTAVPNLDSSFHTEPRSSRTLRLDKGLELSTGDSPRTALDLGHIPEHVLGMPSYPAVWFDFGTASETGLDLDWIDNNRI